MHTLDLPAQNRTPDTEIVRLASEEQRVVVTKGADFVTSFTLNRRPEKLLLISTGNITNTELEALLQPNIRAIIAALEEAGLVELTRTALIAHS